MHVKITQGVCHVVAQFHFLKLFKTIYLFFVIATITWYTMCSYSNISNKKISEQKVELKINESDNRMCYKNFVFDKNNEKYRFPDIMNDEILKDSDGQNIFFHLTNCIHDGIPHINSRFGFFFLK